MSGSASVVLGDVCHAKTENRNPSREPDERFQYVDIASVDNTQKTITEPKLLLGRDAPSRARKVIRTNDVIVSMTRPNLNAVALVPPELDGEVCSTGFAVLRANERTIPEYIFHFVTSRRFVDEVSGAVAGAMYPATSETKIKSIELPLPPLPEQQRIVDILNRANGIRRLRKEAQEKARQVIPALFVEMFGDPVSNPKGWPEVVIGDLVHSAKDGPHVSPKYADDGIPFLSTRHVKPGRVIFEDLKYIAPDEAERQWKKCKPERGDILYTKGGTTGIAAAIDFDREVAVWVHVALLKTKHEIVEPLWLECMLNSDYCYAQSQHLTHGIANRDLGLTRMVNIRAYLPPLDAQRAFVNRLKELNSITSVQDQGAASCEHMVNSLMTKLFT